MQTLVVSILALLGFISGIAVHAGALLPPVDPLAPVPGWETRYVLAGENAPIIVSRGKYDAYLSSCTNEKASTKPHITPGYHVRVFICEL